MLLRCLNFGCLQNLVTDLKKKKLCFQKVDIPSHSSNIGNWNLLCIRVRRNGLMVAWEPDHLDASYCQFVSPSKLNLRPICHNTEKKH